MHRRLLMILAVLPLLPGVACKGVDFTAPPTAQMTISANPLTIPLTGGSTRISVSIIEGSGVPVPNGTVVRFTTTLGEVDPESETKDGLVSATLRSGGVAGTATVTAFSGPVSQTIDITIGVTPQNISLTATPASLPTGGGTVNLTATVFGANASPVAGATVAFSTTAGSLGSSGNPVVADGNGVARDTLTTSRTAMVTITSGASTATIEVPVGSVGTVSIVLAADRVTLPATGGTVTLVAVVLGESGPVPDVAVAWSASAGTLSNPGLTQTNLDGEATNSLTTSVTTVVTAIVSNQTATLTITVGSGITPTLSIAANRSSIPLLSPALMRTDPCQSSPMATSVPIRVSAQMQDQNGNPLANRDVTFFVEFGELADCARAYGEFCDPLGMGGNTVTARTNGSGIAEVSFTMTDEDIAFCNCLPSGCTMGTAIGQCPNSCAAECRTNPTTMTTEDLFCQVAISAVAGGVFSDNFQFIEYGR